MERITEMSAEHFALETSKLGGGFRLKARGTPGTEEKSKPFLILGGHDCALFTYQE